MEGEIARAVGAFHAAHPGLLIDAIYTIPAEAQAALPDVRATISLRDNRFPKRS